MQIQRLLLQFHLWVALITTPAFALDNCSSHFSDQMLIQWQDLGFQFQQGHGPPQYWGVDGTVQKGMEYEFSFEWLARPSIANRTISRQPYFDRFLQERRRNNQGTHVLELFGSGFFVDEIELADSLTGFRWDPFDLDRMTSDIRKYGPSAKREIPPAILGDIMNPDSWSQLDASMRSRSIPKMDLVVSRPVWGWKLQPYFSSIEGNTLAIAYIVTQTIRRLSNHGEFYFEFSIDSYDGDFLEHPTIRNLRNEVETTSSFRIDWKLYTTNGLLTNVLGVVRPK